MNIKIEVLFPEICNLYGDLFNVELLKRSYPEIEIINTSLKSEPLFVKEKPNMIYMGSVTERGQELAAKKLYSYRKRIIELIDDNALILLTGNAIDIFSSYIELETGEQIRCLDILPAIAQRHMMSRYNSLYLGKFMENEIVGFKSQFTHLYGDNADCYLFDTIKGAGLNPNLKNEGFKINNLLCTYLIGPVLLLNPPFAKYILKLIGINDPVLAYEQDCYESYYERIKEFNEPGKKFEGELIKVKRSDKDAGQNVTRRDA